MKLRYSIDYRTLTAIALYGLLIGLSMYYFSFAWYIFIPILVLNCMGNFLVACIVHNTIHSPIFTKKQPNQFFQYILSIVKGYPVSAFVSDHNLSHHKHLLTSKDVGRPTQVNFKWNLLNQLVFSFVVVRRIERDRKKFFNKMKTLNPEWAKQFSIEKALALTFKVIMLIINPWAGLFVVVLPQIFGSWGVMGTNYFQHDGCDGEHPYNHSRSFTGRIYNFLTFNNGYHGAHHAKAHLHWSLYPKFHNEKIAPSTHPNLIFNNFLHYLFLAYFKPGKRVDYLGNDIKNVEITEDDEWISDIKVYSKNLETDMGGVR